MKKRNAPPMRSQPTKDADNAPGYYPSLNKPNDVSGVLGNILIGAQGEVQGHSVVRALVVEGSSKLPNFGAGLCSDP
eukprot:2034149-Heterocapsa_arctica.AAC.1